MNENEKHQLTVALAGYLPYQLQFKRLTVRNNSEDQERIKTLCGVYTDTNLWMVDLYGTKHNTEFSLPILHDLSALTKPITVKSYNEGKEFVPLLELAKFRYDDIKWMDGNFELKDNKVYFESYESINWFWYNERNAEFVLEMNGEQDYFVGHMQIFDLLNQWKINWRNLPKHLWIDVESLENNPYK